MGENDNGYVDHHVQEQVRLLVARMMTACAHHLRGGLASFVFIITFGVAFGQSERSDSSVTWRIDTISLVGGYGVSVFGDPVVRQFPEGDAVEFDGRDDGMIVKGCPIDGAASFTIEILFKPYPAYPENREQRFLHVQHPDRPHHRAMIELRLTEEGTWFTDTHLREDSAALTLLAKDYPHPLGPWYHGALVYENGTGRHYVNGVEEMSGRVTMRPIDGAHVSLGMRMNAIWHFRGAISTVRWSRRALSPHEFLPEAYAYAANSPGPRAATVLVEEGTSTPGDWIVECEDPAGSSVTFTDNGFDVTTSAGATVWYGKKFSGDIVIAYDGTVVDSGGVNDRVSDMNVFWMASDPAGETPFPRNGTFSSYDDLNLYYAGIGGHDNTTSRFRRYRSGSGKPVLMEYTDPQHLLQGNRTYSIVIVVQDGHTSYFVDAVKYFAFDDPEPLSEGFVGIRTTRSHQRVENFRVMQLRPRP